MGQVVDRDIAEWVDDVPDGHDQVGPPDGVQDLGGVDRRRRDRARCEVVDGGGRGDVFVGAEVSADKKRRLQYFKKTLYNSGLSGCEI